jgi:hypothetical protein
MSQKYKYPVYFRVIDCEIYIRLEENRRTSIGLNFGEINKCFVEWKYGDVGLDSRVSHIFSSEKEFINAMLQALDAKELSLNAR